MRKTLRKERVAQPRGLGPVIKTAIVVPILLNGLQYQRFCLIRSKIWIYLPPLNKSVSPDLVVVGKLVNNVR